MKFLKHLLQKHLSNLNQDNIVHYISPYGILQKLDKPILASKLTCSVCSGSNFYAVPVNPAASKDYLWICASPGCASNLNLPRGGAISPLPTSSNPLLWPLFCEINGIGDDHHEVTFEKIDQSPGKIEYMEKFIQNPKGIIFMQGDNGTGKTYAAMGMCEKFIRTSQSCIFVTQHQLELNLSQIPNYEEKISRVELLVIDDFGLLEPTPKFLDTFMSIINSRNQWKRRGTIITTNLTDKIFADFCGNAILDRIATGQKFLFTGESRRKKVIL